MQYQHCDLDIDTGPLAVILIPVSRNNHREVRSAKCVHTLWSHATFKLQETVGNRRRWAAAWGKSALTLTGMSAQKWLQAWQNMDPSFKNGKSHKGVCITESSSFSGQKPESRGQDSHCHSTLNILFTEPTFCHQEPRPWVGLSASRRLFYTLWTMALLEIS